MLKITRLADYSILILCCFDKKSRKKLSAPKISEMTGLSLHTVNKILSKLVKGNILKTLRGVSGGYIIKSNLDNISINDIIEVVEGPVAVTNCLSKSSSQCNLTSICVTKKTWNLVNDAIIKTLQGIKIKDIHNSKSFISAEDSNII